MTPDAALSVLLQHVLILTNSDEGCPDEVEEAVDVLVDALAYPTDALAGAGTLAEAVAEVRAASPVAGWTVVLNSGEDRRKKALDAAVTVFAHGWDDLAAEAFGHRVVECAEQFERFLAGTTAPQTPQEATDGEG